MFRFYLYYLSWICMWGRKLRNYTSFYHIPHEALRNFHFLSWLVSKYRPLLKNHLWLLSGRFVWNQDSKSIFSDIEMVCYILDFLVHFNWRIRDLCTTEKKRCNFFFPSRIALKISHWKQSVLIHQYFFIGVVVCNTYCLKGL